MFYGFFRILLGPIFRILFPMKVINKDRIPKNGNVIVVCNHLKKMDIVYLHLTFKGKSYIIGKKEWFKNKFVAWVLNKMGGIPIDRENTDFKAMKAVVKVLKDDKRLIIFPEGTRNKTAEVLLPLKDGTGFFAHRCDSTILPVFIAKRSKLFRKNYIYVGQPYKLDCIGQKFTPALSSEITEEIKEKLLICHDELEKYLAKKKKK